jgi:phenylalanyl-tRNA synthetase beta chain
MILSINFLRDYLDLDKDIDVHELAEKMTAVGNEYDSAKKFIDATNLVIGKVEECVEHPDSDHLHVCQVNIGDKILQIVCGAPNVRKGLKVIVALDGAKLPGGEIKKSSIRGVESNGMLCSIAELGIDNKFLKEADKAGIHELSEDAPIGKDPIEYMGWNDGVIDFELTANRGDLLSIIGMAYEVGAIYDKKVKEIDIHHNENDRNVDDNFKVEINTENCSLFLAKKVENIKIKESTPEIKEKLMASGIRPINNVVDISNYVMIETGQPLHFYDADKLNGKIEVRMAQEGEKLTTLDKQERVLSSDDIVISNGENAIGLAGVMGGLDTEITENTKNVIIESAIFDSVKVRRTSNKILRSEASNRFEKGLDPKRTYIAIERACNMLEKYVEGEVEKGIVKYDKINSEDKKIDITVSNIDKILGTDISKEEILKAFEKLGFETKTNGEIITVTVPSRRIDISIKEDLIEEVGRIYGVDNIEGKKMTLTVKKGSYDRTAREIRNKMINLGLNETLTYALVNEEESKMFTTNEKESIKILAPLTEERSALRQSLITPLYKVYEYNKAHDVENISIFEIGKTFYMDKNSANNVDNCDEKYVEENKLACFMSGKYYLGLENKNVDFYVIKGVAEEILDYLGYAGRYSFVTDKQISTDMHPGKTATISVNNDNVGTIGRISPVITKDEVYAMEINLDKLLDKKVGKMKYKEISKFPSVKKDIAILVDNKIEAQDLQKAIKSSGGRMLQNSEVFDLYTGKGIPEGKKSIAFSIELADASKTLTDEEVIDCISKITENLKAKFGAELRS